CSPLAVVVAARAVLVRHQVLLQRWRLHLCQPRSFIERRYQHPLPSLLPRPRQFPLLNLFFRLQRLFLHQSRFENENLHPLRFLSSYQAALSRTPARTSQADESLNQWRPGSGGRYDGTGDWLARGFRRTGVAAPGTTDEERTAGSAAVGRGADL